MRSSRFAAIVSGGHSISGGNLTNISGAARRPSLRHGWRATVRAWGPPGNERLTSSTGLVLVVLLAVETLTTLALRSYLSVHIFLGLVLLPPIGLKLASTGWRFVRYYTRVEHYRLHGPPRALLRALAPLLVASTLSLFGSGVALIAVGNGGGALRTLHTLSFIVWGPLMGVHVVAYLKRALRRGSADWRRQAEVVVAGARSRRALLLGSLVAGAILALSVYPIQHFRAGGGHDGARLPATRLLASDNRLASLSASLFSSTDSEPKVNTPNTSSVSTKRRAIPFTRTSTTPLRREITRTSVRSSY